MEKQSGIVALNQYFGLGIPMSAQGRRRFDFPRDLFEPSATVGTVRAFREMSECMNRSLSADKPDGETIRPGELMGAALLLSAMRCLIYQYGESVNPRVLRDAQQWTLEERGHHVADKPFQRFLDLFPPDPVYTGSIRAADYIVGEGPFWSNRDGALCELLLLDLAVANRALHGFLPLFDDTELRDTSAFAAQISAFHDFLKNQPPVPGTDQDLVTFLYAPLLAAPDSLEGQLTFLRKEWSSKLPDLLLRQMDVATGVLKEEEQFRGHGPGPAQVLEFTGDSGNRGEYEEPEAFSRDQEWMSNVVLLAKTVYVWLDQLSRQYERSIQRLDQIPDEELDTLSAWGVTGLWLIGLWERSEPSRTIKQMMGNPEAAASAYSLYDYEIAADLGGVPAYDDLARRAWARGIRLASDMVPNHVGIFSRWVLEHPDWFIQSNEAPFPNYNFTGADLSPEDRVGIYIEDGYWEHRDAAVVFKRVDHWTGHTRYIYHGNDGTSMPWNDTAQLNYLLPEVREAVIQTILHVARMFPIIRFDAAMTLAKKHYQRLWFPLPDEAGAIPSRAEHGMSRPDFDAVFPVEFWRDVVDRVAAEVPDTLLLAEAFWLMEGYFVRTLGMHRVYNSAFMNMLKAEENEKYRQTIKNVLEFSPEILQRFVNFMNNPDEDTAEAQFGKDNKYFGVAVLMVTMPGLPMIGHGQVEGFTEKYGMEYRRAYRDESPDEDLIQRHEREIFPLMRLRHLFSGAADFAFFDFVTPDGWVDENVFAYSNRVGDARAVIVYQNVHGHTEGKIHWSTSRNIGTVDEVSLRQIPIGEALDLRGENNCYYIYRDSCTGLEYLEYAPRIHQEGLFVTLAPYQYVALLDWRLVVDVDNSWGYLHGNLAGQGVPSMEEAYQELHLAPLLQPFVALMNAPLLRKIHTYRGVLDSVPEFFPRMQDFLDVLANRLDTEIDTAPLLAAVQRDLVAIYDCEAQLREGEEYPELRTLLQGQFSEGNDKSLPLYRILLAWALLRHLGSVLPDDTGSEEEWAHKVAATSGAWIREWFLRKYIAQAFQGLGATPEEAAADASLVRICVSHAHHILALETEVWGPLIYTIFRDGDVESFLGVNTWQGREWLNRERLETMLNTLLLTLQLRAQSEENLNWDKRAMAHDATMALEEAAAGTNYDYGWMLTCVK